MPITMQLHLMRRAQQLGFGKIVANQLHANRQAICAQSRRQAQCGQARQINGNGLNIRKIGLHGVSVQLA